PKTSWGFALVEADLDSQPRGGRLLQSADGDQDLAGLVLVCDPSPLGERVDDEDAERMVVAVDRRFVNDDGPRLTKRLLTAEMVYRAVEIPAVDLAGERSTTLFGEHEDAA